MMRIPKHRHWLLCEALRRHTRFNLHGTDLRKPLTEAWTGLGSYSEYRTVLDAGLMTYATRPNPGYITWWKLTESGAKIVQYWLDQGFTYEDIEADNGPPRAVEKAVGLREASA